MPSNAFIIIHSHQHSVHTFVLILELCDFDNSLVFQVGAVTCIALKHNVTRHVAMLCSSHLLYSIGD